MWGFVCIMCLSVCLSVKVRRQLSPSTMWALVVELKLDSDHFYLLSSLSDSLLLLLNKALFV